MSNLKQSGNILILGVGNLLLGDEGVGVHCIKELEKINLPEKVQLLDGGTGGFHLLGYLQDYPVIIMIDATIDGKPAGTVSMIEPKFSSDFPKALSAHDIGLKDLVESAVLLEHLPKIYLFTVSIEDIQNFEINLTPQVKTAIPHVIDKIHNLLKQLMSI